MSDETPKKPLVEYPTSYAFKVMGKPEDGFSEHIRLKFTRLLGVEVGAEAMSENASKAGKYVSITVTVVLTTEEQRQAIYADIHSDERIVYYL